MSKTITNNSQLGKDLADAIHYRVCHAVENPELWEDTDLTSLELEMLQQDMLGKPVLDCIDKVSSARYSLLVFLADEYRDSARIHEDNAEAAKYTDKAESRKLSNLAIALEALADELEAVALSKTH